ncbi:hypothetical protein D046_8329A, partial [Vibrio parahaemolyticus V-223/04]
MLKAETLLAET